MRGGPVFLQVPRVVIGSMGVEGMCSHELPSRRIRRFTPHVCSVARRVLALPTCLLYEPSRRFDMCSLWPSTQCSVPKTAVNERHLSKKDVRV